MIPVLTFLSDFGSRDAYVAQVKAVILSRVPEARIVDISHEMGPFNLIEVRMLPMKRDGSDFLAGSAFGLRKIARHFSEGQRP